MGSLHKDCKRRARQAMRAARGGLLCAAVVVFLLYALTAAGSALTVARPALNLSILLGLRLVRLLFLLPLAAGVVRLLCGDPNRRQVRAAEVFWYFRPRRYGKTTALYFCLLLRATLPVWLAFAPLGVSVWLVGARGYIDLYGAGLLAVSALAAVLLLALAADVMLNGFFAPFFYLSCPDLPIRRVFRLSKAAAVGRKRKLVGLAVSLLPATLSFVILPLAPFTFLYIVAVFSVYGKIESDKVYSGNALSDTIKLHTGVFLH